MNNEIDNPPAFPGPVSRVAIPQEMANHPNVTEIKCYDNGMSLRDYFAAAAMQKMIALTGWDSFPHDVLSKQAYALATAMLAERSKS